MDITVNGNDLTIPPSALMAGGDYQIAFIDEHDNVTTVTIATPPGTKYDGMGG